MRLRIPKNVKGGDPMSRGLGPLLSHLVAQKEQHLAFIQSWMDSGDKDDLSRLRYHAAASCRVDEEMERVLNLLERG
jgi:hypothetical protein